MPQPPLDPVNPEGQVVRDALGRIAELAQAQERIGVSGGPRQGRGGGTAGLGQGAAGPRGYAEPPLELSIKITGQKRDAQGNPRNCYAWVEQRDEGRGPNSEPLWFTHKEGLSGSVGGPLTGPDGDVLPACEFNGNRNVPMGTRVRAWRSDEASDFLFFDYCCTGRFSASPSSQSLSSGSSASLSPSFTDSAFSVLSGSLSPVSVPSVDSLGNSFFTLSFSGFSVGFSLSIIAGGGTSFGLFFVPVVTNTTVWTVVIDNVQGVPTVGGTVFVGPIDPGQVAPHRALAPLPPAALATSAPIVTVATYVGGVLASLANGDGTLYFDGADWVPGNSGGGGGSGGAGGSGDWWCVFDPPTGDFACIQGPHPPGMIVGGPYASQAECQGNCG